jgi:hypothetical protein
MPVKALTPDEYLNSLPEERGEALRQLRKILLKSLPKGFEEHFANGMINYVVPKSIFPQGYHTKGNLPLPFISIGSTKSHIAFHHIGMYASKELTDWFQESYPQHSKYKLDMGKGCVRFTKPTEIPFPLIELLAKKLTPLQWVACYQQAFQARDKKK